MHLTDGWPRLTHAWPLTPWMKFSSVKGSSYIPNVVAIGHSWAIWPLVDHPWRLTPAWPLTPEMQVLPTKFGGHRSFLKELDLWVTSNLWSGRFEKLTVSHGHLAPTTLPSFSSMPRSTTKHIAGYRDKNTDLNSLFFINIDDKHVQIFLNEKQNYISTIVHDELTEIITTICILFQYSL